MSENAMEVGNLVLRAIEARDLTAIKAIAGKVGPGFTSLPNEPTLIQKKVEHALKSFQGNTEKNEASFIFVLEDLAQNTVVGTAAIDASVSCHSPYYNYEVATVVQRSEALNKEMNHEILCLVNHFQDASVLCTLYLDAGYRGKKRGEFLSRARFLFIAEFPDLFSNLFIAEMRGYFDEHDNSPFWRGLGKRFFECDFNEAHFIAATQGSKIIADLMPSYPIYTCLLDKSARDAIAKPHPTTEPAMHVLEKEGFHYRNYVDILDAGPIIEVEKNSIKTVNTSKKYKIADLKTDLRSEQNLSMISNTTMNFRAGMGAVRIEKDHIILEKQLGLALELDIGDWVRVMKLV